MNERNLLTIQPDERLLKENFVFLHTFIENISPMFKDFDCVINTRTGHILDKEHFRAIRYGTKGIYNELMHPLKQEGDIFVRKERSHLKAWVNNL